MFKYTVKRLLYSAIILFFVMFIIYALMYNMPSSFVETKAREWTRALWEDISSG